MKDLPILLVKRTLKVQRCRGLRHRSPRTVGCRTPRRTRGRPAERKGWFGLFCSTAVGYQMGSQR
ncbi:hypothetical protein JKG47_11240 [Acidithiobacillus sp. MC6.1]|nr:hypothetical protein [Acidithiobacillus sp. MC6.1]